MQDPIEKLKQEQKDLQEKLRHSEKNNPNSKLNKIRQKAKDARKARKKNRK